MILRPNQLIAGHPAREIRRLLREIRHLQMACGYVRDVLGCSMEEAKEVVEALEREGYLSRNGRVDGQQLYETTVNGNQLAEANLCSISRVTAEKKLRGFMERVHAANSNPDYLETITGVIVFGSFLSEKEELGDLDVGIRLERKPMSGKVFLERAEARRKLAQERGRLFRNLSEWMTPPSEEIRLFLKSGARQLSIHDFRERKLIPPFRGKILLGERRALAKALPNAQLGIVKK